MNIELVAITYGREAAAKDSLCLKERNSSNLAVTESCPNFEMSSVGSIDKPPLSRSVILRLTKNQGSLGCFFHSDVLI